MKQIYYTQCPMGYGLGASNGFQIKKLDDGYQVSADFRHLSLRAFPPGNKRTLAPETLRYRRGEGGVAELAYLTPRTNEYHTERGPWGRPGGHFAHGLQLDAAELKAIHDWPAGLYGQHEFWVANVKERRSEFKPLELSERCLRCAPTFENVAPLAGTVSVAQLAGLLTAAARVAREVRTLFLIDDPGRLADWMMLLTFAFPPPWRASLTFSTYHDRPEELPGFRLQGTVPDSSRPLNRALQPLGIIADLKNGTFEEPIDPAPWSVKLAEWFYRRGPEDAQAWGELQELARRAGKGQPPETPWAAEWIEKVFDLHALLCGPKDAPNSLEAWDQLRTLTDWAHARNLGGACARARGPGWWRENRSDAPEARAALQMHLGLSGAWQGDGQPAAWGETVARWSANWPQPEREATIQQVLTFLKDPGTQGKPPSDGRPAFVQGLIRSLIRASPAIADATHAWLNRLPDCNRELLLPLEVGRTIDRQSPKDLQNVLEQAIRLPNALIAVLDVLKAELTAVLDVRKAEAKNGSPERLKLVATALCKALGSASALSPTTVRGVAMIESWALRQGKVALFWLRPYLRDVFGDPSNHGAWRALKQRTPPELQRSLVCAVLNVVKSPEGKLPDEAFRWGVEELLLPLDESLRPPTDPTWPGAYLDRMTSGDSKPSDRVLVERLVRPEFVTLGVPRWLAEARERNQLTDEHKARIDVCRRYAGALNSGDAQTILSVAFPAVAAEERGELLREVLDKLTKRTEETYDMVLDKCRDAWPGAFAPGAPGLAGLGAVVAEMLGRQRDHPEEWFKWLCHMLGRLGLLTARGSGFEPNGLAAEVVAASTRLPKAAEFPWRLRRMLLQNEAAWRALAADMRRDMAGRNAQQCLEALQTWEPNIQYGTHAPRFFEVWLNSCDGPALALAVATYAKDLKTLDRDLPWWNFAQHSEARDDIREAFVRLAPMVPIAEDALNGVQNWMLFTREGISRSIEGWEADLVAIHDLRAPVPTRLSKPNLSDFGGGRWQCLEALSKFHRHDNGSAGRWLNIVNWEQKLPLGALPVVEDRYRFLDSVIQRLDSYEDFQIARFAFWLVAHCDMRDTKRVRDWSNTLAEVVDPETIPTLDRLPLVNTLCAEIERVLRDRR